MRIVECWKTNWQNATEATSHSKVQLSSALTSWPKEQSRVVQEAVVIRKDQAITKQVTQTNQVLKSSEKKLIMCLKRDSLTKKPSDVAEKTLLSSDTMTKVRSQSPETFTVAKSKS